MLITTGNLDAQTDWAPCVLVCDQLGPARNQWDHLVPGRAWPLGQEELVPDDVTGCHMLGTVPPVKAVTRHYLVTTFTGDAVPSMKHRA